MVQVSMVPDTPENQKAYPQPTTQKVGCGFPLAKLGVLFSLQTGAAIAVIIEVFKTHDVKLAGSIPFWKKEKTYSRAAIAPLRGDTNGYPALVPVAFWIKKHRSAD